MSDEDYMRPAQSVLVRLQELGGEYPQAVPLAALSAGVTDRAAMELRDGVRMLLERGVVRCASGEQGSELQLLRDRL